jgi:hypothetical protein
MGQKEILSKVIENLFKESIAENFSNPGKDMGIQIQETFRTPIDMTRKEPLHITL